VQGQHIQGVDANGAGGTEDGDFLCHLRDWPASWPEAKWV
jgi:hypothetical protein